MGREEEEMIQRLTARYVTEFRAGQRPQLSEYLSRYPRYAHAISDFVSYFHALEVDIPRDSESIAPLSQASHAAIDEAWRHVGYADSEANPPLSSLQLAAESVDKSFSQLALEIGLNLDILRKLDRHRILAATIPQELCHRLAKALHQPLISIETYLGRVEQQQLIHGIAESPAVYQRGDQPELDAHAYSFQEAVEQSNALSGEQKGAWHTILAREGLL